MEIRIGFRFSKKHKGLFNKPYWQDYEVIGSWYGDSAGGSSYEWKEKEDILGLTQHIQIMNLPCEESISGQLSYYNQPVKKLIKEIESDLRLLPEFRVFRFST